MQCRNRIAEGMKQMEQRHGIRSAAYSHQHRSVGFQQVVLLDEGGYTFSHLMLFKSSFEMLSPSSTAFCRFLRASCLLPFLSWHTPNMR